MCVFSSHSFGTSSSLDVPAGVTQKEGHRISHPPSFCSACLNFSREKDSAIPSIYYMLYTIYFILYTIYRWYIVYVLYTIYSILYSFRGHRLTTQKGVCVFFPFIGDIKFVGRTSRGHTEGRSPRISHPPFCGACLIFFREKDSAIPSLVDREVELCVLTI